MRTLEFAGTVQRRGGETPELILPGRSDLLLVPPDWPMRLAPGTLTVDVDGFPPAFADLGQGDGLRRLDEGNFRCALAIPQRKIVGNPVQADSRRPLQGFAQVWRANVEAADTGQATACWMLRIIGAASPTRLDLMAEIDLASALRLSDGAVVKVIVREADPPRTPKSPTEWISDWCDAARNVEAEYGREKAMGYLIGEKLLNFLEVAETKPDWRRDIPVFVTEIKALFEPWQLAEFLNTPRRIGAFGHTADETAHRALRESLGESGAAREDARNLLLLEWAKELLLD